MQRRARNDLCARVDTVRVVVHLESASEDVRVAGRLSKVGGSRDVGWRHLLCFPAEHLFDSAS